MARKIFKAFGKSFYNGMLGLGILATGAFVFAPAAHSQDSGPTVATTGNAWVKLCNVEKNTNKEVCVVTQELRNADNGQLLVSFSLRLIKNEKSLAIVSVPPGVLLPPGLGVSVDKGQHDKIEYAVCFPNACVARKAIDDNFINKLKRGNQMVVAVYDSNQKGVGFPLTLTGFTAAYDGPPTDPAIYKQSQEKLNEEIKKRAAQKQSEQQQQNQ